MLIIIVIVIIIINILIIITVTPAISYDHSLFYAASKIFVPKMIISRKMFGKDGNIFQIWHITKKSFKSFVMWEKFILYIFTSSSLAFAVASSLIKTFLAAKSLRNRQENKSVQEMAFREWNQERQTMLTYELDFLTRDIPYRRQRP